MDTVNVDLNKMLQELGVDFYELTREIQFFLKKRHAFFLFGIQMKSSSHKLILPLDFFAVLLQGHADYD